MSAVQLYTPKIHTDPSDAYRYRCPFTGKASNRPEFAADVQRQILALDPVRDFFGGELPHFKKNHIYAAKDKHGYFWVPVMSDDREIDDGWRRLRVVDPIEFYKDHIYESQQEEE